MATVMGKLVRGCGEEPLPATSINLFLLSGWHNIKKKIFRIYLVEISIVLMIELFIVNFHDNIGLGIQAYSA